MRSSQQIIDQTNKIARIIYSRRGYSTPEGYTFHEEKINRHPQEREAWSAACDIQELMTNTDVENALADLDIG